MAASKKMFVLGSFVAMFIANGCTNSSPTTSSSDKGASVAAETVPGRDEQDLMEIDAADFDATSTKITNRFMPLEPGMRFQYTGSDLVDGKRVAHTVDYIVTDLTRMVNGIKTVVIWDRDYSEGELEEAELTFFAQDKAGNVWHLGQYSEIYDGRELLGARGFLVGATKGAKAGIMMPVNPRENTPSFSEGWSPGPIYWSDRARVYKAAQTVKVPAGSYKDVLTTQEYSADHNDGFQVKSYAPGVGTVLVGFQGNDAEGEKLELTTMSRMGPADMTRARNEALETDARARWYSSPARLEQR